MGDQVIENHVGGSDVSPGAGLIAEAVEEVEDGVRLFAFGIVVGGGVDPVVAVVAGDGGMIEMAGDGAAGHAGGGFPTDGAADVHEAGAGVAVRGLGERIGGVVEGEAVDGEGVGVDVGLQSVGGGGPDALFVFLHGEAGADAGDEGFFGVGGAEAEGDFAVGGDFGRFQGWGSAAGGLGGGGQGWR